MLWKSKLREEFELNEWFLWKITNVNFCRRYYINYKFHKKKTIFEAHARIIPQIIRANLIQLRASTANNYAKYRGFSRLDERTARWTFRRVSLVRDPTFGTVSNARPKCPANASRFFVVGLRIAIGEVSRATPPRPCGGEKAVAVIEEIQQLPAESFRRRDAAREVRV